MPVILVDFSKIISGPTYKEFVKIGAEANYQNFYAVGEGKSKKEAKEDARQNLLKTLNKTVENFNEKQLDKRVRFVSPAYFHYECISGNHSASGKVS